MHHVPWMIHVFPHIIGSDSCKSGFLLRYHHALLDGVNIMRLLLKYTGNQDTDTNIKVKTKSKSKDLKISKCQLAGSWVKWFFKTVFAPRDKKNPLKASPQMDIQSPRHIVYRTMDTSVSEIKKLKKSGFTVNDILISCLTGAFAKFATNDFTEPITTPIHVLTPTLFSHRHLFGAQCNLSLRFLNQLRLEKH